MTQVALVHPGQMGVSIGNAAREAGHSVSWAGKGRSEASRERAQKAQLLDAGDLTVLCSNTEVVLSVCPPDQAVSVAKDVVKTGFSGVYLDCNAVSPDTGRAVAAIVEGAGGTCIDGGIIGPPAWRKGSTRLYVSGPGADRILPLFKGSAVDARVVNDQIGAASGLKMAYAGWTKGSAALLMTMFALARQQGVDEALIEEWTLSQPGVEDRMSSAAIGNAPKAWRFVGEMREIEATLKSAGLPESWFDGAARTYERLADFKESGASSSNNIDVEQVIASLYKP